MGLYGAYHHVVHSCVEIFSQLKHRPYLRKNPVLLRNRTWSLKGRPAVNFTLQLSGWKPLRGLLGSPGLYRSLRQRRLKVPRDQMLALSPSASISGTTTAMAWKTSLTTRLDSPVRSDIRRARVWLEAVFLYGGIYCVLAFVAIVWAPV